MHGRGARGAAPASNAATCEGRCWLRVGLRPATCFFFPPTRADAARTRADSRWIGLIRTYSGRIGRNCRNGWFKPKPPRPVQAETADSHFVQTLSLRHSLSWNLKPTIEFRESHISSTPQEPTAHNTTQLLLCWPVTKSWNIKRLWLPQNALCFVFYWTP